MIAIRGKGFVITIETSIEEEDMIKSFTSSFPRRYIPRYMVDKETRSVADASIKWFRDESFRFGDYILRDTGMDEYTVYSPIPKPYVNESPYFFLLQVISRSIVKNGYIVLTDSISFVKDSKTYLMLGYPHTGKSTLSALAIADGAVPLSTENTIISVDGEDGLRIIGGTDVLVYDPVVEEKYGVKIGYHEMTRHGYRIVDLRKLLGEIDKYYGQRIDYIYVLHTSFRSYGADLSPVKGRKIMKILWHYASSLIRGTDYYYPYPLALSTRMVDENLWLKLGAVGETYTGRFYEIYGRHDDVYKYIVYGE